MNKVSEYKGTVNHFLPVKIVFKSVFKKLRFRFMWFKFFSIQTKKKSRLLEYVCIQRLEVLVRVPEKIFY